MVSTASRVEKHTAPQVNRAIREQTAKNIDYYGINPHLIEGRLQELKKEWDIERTIEANAASFTLLGLTLGTFSNRKWYILSAAVAGFLLQHAIQGWCPPVPVLRRLGFRTQTEINAEIYALKAIRGDFAGVESDSGKRTEEKLDQVFNAVEIHRG
jgi:hypothetical protein